MSKPFEVKVDCRRGAPMGRSSDDAHPDCALTLERVPLDRGGYDPGGAYWGTGEPLFCVWTDDAEEFVYEFYLRAPNRDAAAIIYLKEHPAALLEAEELPGFQEFFDSYVEAALWSSTDDRDPTGEEPLDASFDESDLSEECRAQMLADCRSFLESNAVAIGTEYTQAGHDFWLTRNGHGAGFWDRSKDLYPGDNDELSKAAHAYGSVDLYVSEGKIHHS